MQSSFSPTPILDLIETVSKDTAKYMGSYYLNDPYAFGSGSLNQSVDGMLFPQYLTVDLDIESLICMV